MDQNEPMPEDIEGPPDPEPVPQEGDWEPEDDVLVDVEEADHSDPEVFPEFLGFDWEKDEPGEAE